MERLETSRKSARGRQLLGDAGTSFALVVDGAALATAVLGRDYRPPIVGECKKF